jgi:hypothetical protein
MTWTLILYIFVISSPSRSMMDMQTGYTSYDTCMKAGEQASPGTVKSSNYAVQTHFVYRCIEVK